MAHALFSPSGSSKWMRCYGSLNAEKGLPDSSSAAAEEGTAAHEMAELCLLNKDNAVDYIGRVAENGIEMTEDMAFYVQHYVDYARSFKGDMYIEERVDITPWAAGSFGTADCVVVQTKQRRVHVIDLKFGKGLQVFADNNSQLMMYALGVYNEFSYIAEFDEFVLHVGQPRLDHFDEWAVSTADLLKFGERVLAACVEAMKPDAPRVAGETQCQWCKARSTCRTRTEWTLNFVADYSEDLDMIELKEPLLNMDEVAKLLPHLSAITKWVNDLKGYASVQAEQGVEIPDHKLVAGRSQRKWRNADDAAAALRRIRKLRVADVYKKTVITPTQAEKLLGKGHALLTEQVIKPQGKPALVPSSDKRPAFNAVADDLALFDED